MKTNFILTALSMILCYSIFAQVAINEDNSNPDPSAILDVQSIDKGVLIPRLTTSQRSAVSSPANGLLVFDSQTESFWYYVSGAWSELKDSSTGHLLSDTDGNTKVDVEENVNEDIVRIKIAGTERGFIDSTRMDLFFPDSSTIIGHMAGNENAIITNPSSDDQGKFNTFVGLLSGYHNNPDPYDCSDYEYYNIYESGCGSHNTFLGNKAGLSNINGRNNLFIGSRAGINNIGEYYYNVGEGGPGSENTFLGFLSGHYNTNGYWNTFLGAYSGEENGLGVTNFDAEGSHNTYLGVYAGRFNRNGRQNTYVGTEAGGGWDSNTGERNVYIGRRAGYGNTGDQNVFVGTDAGYSFEGDNFPGYRNTYIGNEAGFFNDGSDNVFIGNRAGYSESGNNKLYIANDDTNTPLIYGDFAQQTATIHGFLGIGTTTPSTALEVAGNASIINNSGNAELLVNSLDGSKTSVKLFEGDEFGFEFEYDGETNVDKLYLWSRKFVGNEGIRMTWLKNGNVGIGTVSPTQLLTVNGSAGKPGGGTWSSFSDKRLKQDISPYEVGLEEVLRINPVRYRYNTLSGHDTKQEHIGVIAQEIQEIAPYMVSTYEMDGEEYLQVDNSAMTYMLINAVKELNEENNQLKEDIAQIKSLLEIKAQKQ